jgi:hypothetical protein
VCVQEAGGDAAEQQELRKRLAAAERGADVLRAELKALRKHAKSLEKQLRSARAGASLEDIRRVAGRDGRLVRCLLSFSIPADSLASSPVSASAGMSRLLPCCGSHLWHDSFRLCADVRGLCQTSAAEVSMPGMHRQQQHPFLALGTLLTGGGMHHFCLAPPIIPAYGRPTAQQ